MTTSTIAAASVVQATSNNAVLISTPKKSSYQFYCRKDYKSVVAKIVRDIMPEAKPTTARDPKKELVFFSSTTYRGWVGFNLPGVFETRKKIAGALYRHGWKSGVAVELLKGGLRLITNKYDRTGTVELPENTGGCAGCANNNYDRCIGCPDNYRIVAGRKIWKKSFDQHTNSRR